MIRKFAVFLFLFLLTSAAFAVSGYQAAAERGDAQAQYQLGLCYGKGMNVKKDYREAVKWWRLAATQGHAKAQFNLGLCYAKGLGVAQSDIEAVKLWRKAAEKNVVEAQHNLGFCYLYGLGIGKDHTEAFHWFLKAAKAGDAMAQYKVAYCYYKGYGCIKNEREEKKWLEAAAEQGDFESQRELAFYYDMDMWCYLYLTLLRDPKKAKRAAQLAAIEIAKREKWLLRVAERGDAEAQYRLGEFYLYGINGMKKDRAKAIKWLRAAARQNFRPAKEELNKLGETW